ncbi:MAG: RluA family pseudouridine synthase [Proteobacteria bacterium]|nr:RluA family pseudouridine synthase [Pseudomonadota bacterium]
MNRLDRLHSALTSTHWVFTYRTPRDCPATVVAALTKELPHIEASSWQSRMAFGGLYVNGEETIEDISLTAPCRVEYYEPKFEIGEASTLFTHFSTEQIVFEDDDLVAVFKPAKLPCGQSKEQRHFYLRKFVEDYLGKAVHMPSRLDTSAQGLVLFSKSKRMHAVLQHAFEKHSVEKYYLLHVSPGVSWQKKLVENRIDRDPQHPILRTVVDSGGLSAVTHFRTLATVADNPGPAGSLLLAKPQTGRTHQLRVHTSTLGHPIVGDNFYGGAVAPELRLLALRFRFHNKLAAKTVEITLPDRWLPAWVPPNVVRRE